MSIDLLNIKSYAISALWESRSNSMVALSDCYIKGVKLTKARSATTKSLLGSSIDNLYKGLKLLYKILCLSE